MPQPPALAGRDNPGVEIDLLLTPGAEVRPALADHDLFNRRPTHRAGFPCPAIDVEVVLKFTPAVKPIQAGAKPANALAQDRLDGLLQFGRLLGCDVVGFTQGVNPRPEQGFIGVDIAQPGDEGLVHQQGLDLPGAALEHAVQPLPGEGGVEGFRAQ